MTEFLRELMKEIKEQSNGIFEPVLHTKAKVNGSWEITMELKEKNVSGTDGVPLLSFYQKYQKGTPMEELAQELILCHEKKRARKLEELSWSNDWEQVKERIIYRLVNPDVYRLLLKKRYYIPVMGDLAVVFYILSDIVVPQDGTHHMIPVTREMTKRFHKRADEILEQAIENMRIFSSHVLYEMCTVKGNIKYYPENLEELEQLEEPQMGLLVATNRTEHFGAGRILDREWMGEIARLMNSDFYIIAPTSHQATLQSAEKGYLDAGHLKTVAESVKETGTKEDYLSDSVYYFEREQKTLYKVA